MSIGQMVAVELPSGVEVSVNPVCKTCENIPDHIIHKLQRLVDIRAVITVEPDARYRIIGEKR